MSQRYTPKLKAGFAALLMLSAGSAAAASQINALFMTQAAYSENDIRAMTQNFQKQHRISIKGACHCVPLIIDSNFVVGVRKYVGFNFGRPQTFVEQSRRDRILPIVFFEIIRVTKVVNR